GDVFIVQVHASDVTLHTAAHTAGARVVDGAVQTARQRISGEAAGAVHVVAGITPGQTDEAVLDECRHAGQGDGGTDRQCFQSVLHKGCLLVNVGIQTA